MTKKLCEILSPTSSSRYRGIFEPFSNRFRTVFESIILGRSIKKCAINLRIPKKSTTFAAKLAFGYAEALKKYV